MVGTNGRVLRISLRLRVLAPALLAGLAWASAPVSTLAAAAKQKTFATPEQAVEALVSAARADKPSELVEILGPDGKLLVYSGDPVADKEGRLKFVAAYDEASKLVKQGDDKAALEIGQAEWPFPIPIVKEGHGWRFDTKAGKQEILARRIGRNELNTIEVCRAYVDAQREYAAAASSGSGLREYAQRFMSRPGSHDGLYWQAAEGEAESPMGPLVASARAEGYGGKTSHGKRSPYHGYYYRILTKQGKHAPGGAFDYIVNGHMIGGFALVAFPAKYGDSGVMTFLVSHDGIVHEKDLGPDTAIIARRITAFDPDPSWKTP